jgi:hypothetical protein
VFSYVMAGTFGAITAMSAKATVVGKCLDDLNCTLTASIGLISSLNRFSSQHVRVCRCLGYG